VHLHVLTRDEIERHNLRYQKRDHADVVLLPIND